MGTTIIELVFDDNRMSETNPKCPKSVGTTFRGVVLTRPVVPTRIRACATTTPQSAAIDTHLVDAVFSNAARCDVDHRHVEISTLVPAPALGQTVTRAAAPLGDLGG